MKIDDFMKKIKSSYPIGQHPGDEGEKQYFQYLHDSKYSPKQLKALLARVLKTSEYFPSIAWIVRCANELSYHAGAKTPEVNWSVFHVDGKCYARRDGHILHQTYSDYTERLKREACSIEEGRRIRNQAYKEYVGSAEPVNQLSFDPWEYI